MPHVPAKESARIGDTMSSALKGRINYIMTLSEVSENQMDCFTLFFCKCN